MDRINHPYEHYNIKRMLGECLLISSLLGKDSRKLVESKASVEQFNICETGISLWFILQTSSALRTRMLNRSQGLATQQAFLNPCLL